jgi:hypothetical protein
MTISSRRALLIVLAVTIAGPARAIEPTMDIFIENPLQPIFHGATNLPDGSGLMLTLSRPEIRYMAQAKTSVKVGHFTTEQFSSGGRPLNPGLYKIEISMGMAELQPKQVQAVIGDRGQKMTGNFVFPAPIGDGFWFRYATQRQIGGAPNAALDAAARAQAIADLRKWRVESCTSIIDLVNASVRAGTVTGREVRGSERQSKIDACIAETNAPPTR